jgi:glycopeptide antibiotics resistance protein
MIWRTVRPSTLAALLLSVGLVVVAGYPWRDFVGHSHWEKVGWIPFVSSPVRPRDVLGNLLLCAPIGVVTGWNFRRGTIVACSVAAAVSLFVESAQLYSHTRFPSATDVFCNIGGAVIAAALVRRHQHRMRGW